MTSFAEDKHAKNTASVERIADYIVQRDNAYDQKLIKIALERDVSINRGRKDREEKMAFYNNERKVKNKEANTMQAEKFKAVTSEYFSYMRKKVKKKAESTNRYWDSRNQTQNEYVSIKRDLFLLKRTDFDTTAE